MRYAGLMVVLALALAVSGCAGSSGKPASLNMDVPNPVQVSGVPVVEQQDKQCAAAALEMATAPLGHASGQDFWKERVFTPGREGALPQDMLTAARREGLAAYLLESPQQLPAALAEGYPVIVLLNLRFSWWPQWHYAVVTGYDAGHVRLHAGRNEAETWKRTLFERLWKRSGYWAMAVSYAGSIPDFAGKEGATKSAIGLEKVGQLKAAYIAYHALARKYPAQCVAFIGLGNTAHKLGESAVAEHAWQEASKHPDCAAAAQNNLQFATD